jgi:ribosomal protein L11 methyltransferase
VTLCDAGDAPVFEPALDSTPLWPHARVEALYPLDTDVAKLSGVIDDLCRSRQLTAPAIDIRFVGAEDWSSTWRRFAAPLDFGARLRVAPRDAADVPGRVTLRLDPGLAFGTGTHATTALCLEWLANQPLKGAALVDYGCGSGILGLAALLLGARHVTAVDHDPQARLATADNAAYNDIPPSRLSVIGADVAWHDPADMVVANILADPLIALAPRLSALVRPGGALLLSGLKLAQWSVVGSAYADFDFRQPRARDDWIAVEGIKTGG